MLWVLILALVLMRALLYAPPVTRALAAPVSRWLEKRTGATVSISSVHLDWHFAPCFERLDVTRNGGPLRVQLTTPRACVRQWIPAVASGFHALRIELQSPSIDVRARDREEVRPPSRPRPQPRSSKDWLREVTVTVSDLHLTWGGLPLPTGLAIGSFGPVDGQLILQERAGLVAAVVDFEDRTTKARLQGRVAPQAQAWDLAAGIEADVAPVLGKLLDTEAVRLRSMPTRGRVGLRWLPKEENIRLDLDLEQFDVDFESELVTRDRLRGFDARERGVASLDLRRRKLSVRNAALELNGIVTELELDVSRKGKEAEVALRVALRSTPFGALLESIPGSTVPELARRIPPEVRFEAELEVSGRGDDPNSWTIRLKPRFEGLQPGETGLEHLRGPFPYRPLTKTGRAKKALKTGPGTRGWIPYDEIPFLQRQLIVVAEDGTFFSHEGLEPDGLEAALGETLAGDRRPRGGSTISQQLAKNLFLSRDRTALRKAQEALLALWLDAVFSKRTLFELYANLIEWGPNIYGIGFAAEHLFDTPLEELELQEMAYLATIIPAPGRFHVHHVRGEVPDGHRTRVDKLLEKLLVIEKIDEDTYEEALNAPIVFAPEIPAHGR
ncbi:MAG: biosynthetic peptidoglycan transglycosylase [Myxococcota bacterium]